MRHISIKQRIDLTWKWLFTKFLSDSNARKEGSNFRKIVVKVPRDYDRTEVIPKRWDERILDEDIVRLMRMMYNPKPGKDFARSNCPTVDVHFTPPYSKIAKELFGYENSTMLRDE